MVNILKSETKKKYKKCSQCKKHKRDVKKRLDPYLQDICNIKRWKNLCKKCEVEIAQEI